MAMNALATPAKQAAGTSGEILHGIQYLRFIAATLVFIGHAYMDGREFGVMQGGVADFFGRMPWGSGVDIFFVISGFIIAMLLEKGHSTHGGEHFLANRIIRVAPIYWLYTIVMAVAATLITVKGDAHITPEYLATSLAFIPWPDLAGQPRPVLGQGWTLDYEMYFYVLAFIVITLTARWRGLWLSLLLAGVTLLVFVIGRLTSAGSFYTDFYGNSVALEFIIGIICYNIYRRSGPVPAWLRIAMGVTGAVLILGIAQFGEFDRFLVQGLPAGLIVLAFALPGRSSAPIPWLEELGNASYSLYLLHPFVTNGCALLFSHVARNAWWGYLLMAMVLTVAAAVISYRVIEKPTIAYLRGHLPARLRRAPAA